MKLKDAFSLEKKKKNCDKPRQHIESRDIAFPTKVYLVKAVVFPVVIYGCGSWTIKKAESWRIDAFELWCWRRLLRVPWTARKSNRSILKEISPEYSLEGLMLKLQYFGYLNWLIRKDPDAGKDWRQEDRGWRGWDGWIESPNQWTWVWASSRSWWWTGKPGMLQSMGLQRVRHDWATELNWHNIHQNKPNPWSIKTALVNVKVVKSPIVWCQQNRMKSGMKSTRERKLDNFQVLEN